MGLFNTIHATLQCPRCLRIVDAEIETKFGWTNQLDYVLGDEVRWSSTPEFPPIGRPAEGTGEFPGYCECPSCRRDFWLKVHVVRDHIQNADVDPTQSGYIP